jgi:hypothetical protein
MRGTVPPSILTPAGRSAQELHRLGDHRPDLLQLRQVDGTEMELLAQLRCQCLAILGVHIGNQHTGTLDQEQPHGLFADPGCATRLG